MHLLPKYANITALILTITAKSKSMRIAIILYYISCLFVKYFNICSLDIFTLFLNVLFFFLENHYIFNQLYYPV